VGSLAAISTKMLLAAISPHLLATTIVVVALGFPPLTKIITRNDGKKPINDESHLRAIRSSQQVQIRTKPKEINLQRICKEEASKQLC
jgi:hypothetical protein